MNADGQKAVDVLIKDGVVHSIDANIRVRRINVVQECNILQNWHLGR